MTWASRALNGELWSADLFIGMRTSSDLHVCRAITQACRYRASLRLLSVCVDQSWRLAPSPNVDQTWRLAFVFSTLIRLQSLLSLIRLGASDLSHRASRT